MSALLREFSLFLRARASFPALVLLAALSSLSVLVGLRDVAVQEAAITRVTALQARDTLAVKQHAGEDAGSAAYYRFHSTWDAPEPLAFAALGQRDVSPIMLRVRALALEGQIYESEAGNPELALQGRFDFAFVLIYLAPLALIALLHDLWSSEHEAGRIASLRAMPNARWRVWGARVLVRSSLVYLALLIPFLVGAGLQMANLGDTIQFSILVLALVVFWTLISVIIASRGERSAANAAALAALWFAITLIAPAGANLAVNAMTPIPQGAALVRENREAVHEGWDLDRSTTMARFYKTHPEWRDSPPVGQAFDWKWYFAFQQLGDEHVARTSRDYRLGVEKREQRAGLAGWLLPPIAIQRGLHRLADTDVSAQLAYQDRIRAYHDRLRRYYYPYLFGGRTFTPAEFEKAPEFTDIADGR